MVNQLTNQSFKKRWGIILLIVLVVGLVFLIYKGIRFDVASTDPSNSQMTTWAPYFKVTFTRKLSNQGLSISTDPKQIIYDNQYYVSGNTLTINLNVPLNPNQTYTITINNIKDTYGANIKNKKFVFKPKYITFSQLTNDNQQEALTLRNQASPVYKDPILTHLPYYTLSYSLTPDITTSSQNNLPIINVKAELLLNESQSSNEAGAVAQDKQLIQSYIRSLGLNPSSYNIIYSVSLP